MSFVTINISWKCRRRKFFLITSAFLFNKILKLERSTFLSDDEIPILNNLYWVRALSLKILLLLSTASRWWRGRIERNWEKSYDRNSRLIIDIKILPSELYCLDSIDLVIPSVHNESWGDLWDSFTQIWLSQSVSSAVIHQIHEDFHPHSAFFSRYSNPIYLSPRRTFNILTL